MVVEEAVVDTTMQVQLVVPVVLEEVVETLQEAVPLIQVSPILVVEDLPRLQELLQDKMVKQLTPVLVEQV
jgi:hypothetical protein